MNENYYAAAAYTDSYRRAAERLLIGMVDEINNGGHDDAMIFPAMFLYRHHLELVLKDMVQVAARAMDGEWLERDHRHNLSALWHQLRAYCVRRWPKESRSEMRILDKFIADLHRVDPAGMSFRYSADKADERHLGDVKDVNLKHLIKRIGPIGELLEGIDAAFSAEADLRADVEYEFRDEW